MKHILIYCFLLICVPTYGQMYQWQMDTFTNAEKARKWRTKQRQHKLYKPKARKVSAIRRRKFTYGQTSKIRHKGVR